MLQYPFLHKMYSWRYCMVCFQDTLSSVLPEWPSKGFFSSFHLTPFLLSLQIPSFFCVYRRLEGDTKSSRERWGVGPFPLRLLFSLYFFVCIGIDFAEKSCFLFVSLSSIPFFLQQNLRIRKYLSFFIFPSFPCPFTSNSYGSPWVMILV